LHTIHAGRCRLLGSNAARPREPALSSRKRWLAFTTRSRNAPASGGHRVINIALSLFSTTILTNGLGFVFWTVVARMATTEVVGRAAAIISAMQLIATFCVLGLPTFLVAQLPHYDRAAMRRLVITSLGIAFGVAFIIAAGYGFLYHIIDGENELLYATPRDVALFGVGTGITTLVWVLDGALVGVQKSWRQVSRNLSFALAKLTALPIAALAVGLSAKVVFLVWLLGNVVSLIIVGLRTKSRHEWVKTRPSLRGFSPIWRTAAGHHWVNVALQLPHLAMPIMVATQLGDQANAAFYAALLIATFVWTAPSHIGVGLFTLSGENTADFVHGLNTALRLSALISVLAALGAPLLARPVLGIFGSGYQTATYCLIVLATCTFASATKSIYIGVRRAQGMLGKAARAACLGSALELGAVEVGIKLGTLTDVGIALGTAMAVEALFFWPIVRKARRLNRQRIQTGD
jgi:O-antigen/teichoic acid export membrane protein